MGPSVSPPANETATADQKVNGWSTPPVGYVQFCRSFADQCRQHGREAAASLTAERWRDLQDVNLSVNRSVRPVTDLDYYNSEELWALPSSYGDCEDYVLMKRKLLVERAEHDPLGHLLEQEHDRRHAESNRALTH